MAGGGEGRGVAAGYTQTDTAGEGHAECTRKNNEIRQRRRGTQTEASELFIHFQPPAQTAARHSGCQASPADALKLAAYRHHAISSSQLRVQAGISLVVRDVEFL